VPINDEQADRYVQEQVIAARLIGIEQDDVFTTYSQLKAYFAEMRPFLKASEESREAVKFLVVPPMPNKTRYLTPAQTLWAGMATTAFAALPSWAREMYAGSLLAPVISKVPLADAATSASMWAWRRALLVVPERIRKSPHVAAAEERLGLAA
jgi:uncharacterized protein (DUF2236 family)